MKKNKVIFFDAPQYKSDRDAVTIEHQPDLDYFYMVGFSGLIANVIKDSLPDFDFEVWRIDDRVTQYKSRTVNGILGKIYPMNFFCSQNLVYSLRLIKDLKNEVRYNNLIIIFSGIHSFFFLLISLAFRTIPKVAIQLGGANSYSKFKANRSIISLFYSLIERKIHIKYLAHARLFTAAEKEYFLKELKREKISDLPVLPVDLNLMHPIDKKTARLYLNIPLTDKVIYQTGRAYFNKGTNVTINVWVKFLKDKGIKLIMTGIHESDELYEFVKNSGVDFRPVVPREDLPYWYSAADVYLYPPFDKETLNFGGYGLAPLEALACGTPLVCSTMINFPEYDKNENRIKEICIIPTNEEEVASGVLHFLDFPPAKEKCRSLVTDYFTKEKIGDNFSKTILDIHKMHYL